MSSGSQTVRQLGETALIALGAAAIPFLPRAAVVALARVCGGAAFALARRERRIGLANAGLALGGTLDGRQRAAVVRAAFRTFALVVLDLFWFRRCTRRRLAEHVRFDASFAAWFERRPCVAVTGHYGNWEIMGQAAALRGAPPLSVAADFENPAVNRLLQTARQATGQRTVARRGAIKALLRELRRGGRVALLVDQNTLPEEGGMFVPFFGRPAPVSGAAELLWRRTGAAVVQTYCVADERGRYTLHAAVLAEGGAADLPPGEVTRRVAAALEQTIRARPEQWLWMYKRWKIVPPDADPALYPFYARPWAPAAEAGRRAAAAGA